MFGCKKRSTTGVFLPTTNANQPIKTEKISDSEALLVNSVSKQFKISVSHFAEFYGLKTGFLMPWVWY